MQHWTLCEVLSIANRHHSALNYIDAHAMAPLATKPTSPTQVFRRVQANLPGIQSVYEKAWRTLDCKPADGYPSSAKFVKHVWSGDFSMLLCEIKSAIADEIAAWLPKVEAMPTCNKAKLARGDWRSRFNEGLPSPSDVGLGDDALTLLSFDPNKYNVDGLPGNADPDLYPKDIELTLEAMNTMDGPVLVQLSTYRSGSPSQNPQDKVVASINSFLGKVGRFELSARVRANRNMMSLIYARNVDWADELASLESRFSVWLKTAQKL